MDETFTSQQNEFDKYSFDLEFIYDFDYFSRLAVEMIE